MVARMKKWNDPNLEKLYPTVSNYLKRNQRILSIFKDVSKITDAEIVSTYKELCGTEKCKIFDKGGMYYYDDDHLSSYGALKISYLFEPLMLFEK